MKRVFKNHSILLLFCAFICFSIYYCSDSNSDNEKSQPVFNSTTYTDSGVTEGTTDTKTSTSTLLLIKGGSFTMGDLDALGSPTPHSVTITYDFYIDKYETTQREYNTLIGTNLTELDHPVTNVTWYQAVVFCNKKSIAAGLTPFYLDPVDKTAYDTNDIPTIPEFSPLSSTGYRLLTEAEWEYVARNKGTREGEQFSGSNNIADVAWYSVNSAGATHIVGTKNPNELGIYDMSGNAIEWCMDLYSDTLTNATNPLITTSTYTTRARRGGAYDDTDIKRLQNSIRDGYNPNAPLDKAGFRVGRTADYIVK